ncbi:GNAT family N-acetyltransferase [Streptomyces griseorubiginosus]|uniref:GNAT family N-acetyltransferase n=1 Tax=Streptomyces griseorubiginosus TaxID=67304 RepID=UPI002E81A64E|nr:GNAT family N-acetyltransferase [Streptomyces griseorubiginosus]WUB43826.1 acetyltransferase [Streptomyces griseorubiginosus]WUB52344.1 acetyltransferase [Streptomyces griseorubiginosus]
MSATDAHADAGSLPSAPNETDADADAGNRPHGSEGSATPATDRGTDTEDTLDLRLPAELLALLETEGTGAGGCRLPSCGGSVTPPAELTPTRDDLLDHIADWGPVTTPAGVFQLVPVRVERDLPLVCRWMNDPAVTAFWELAGPQNVTEDHLQSQLTGDGRSVPCLGVLEGAPMSYWEIYRADLDPLARHYPARPHDTGIHLLIGAVPDRGRGLGSTLLRAVADLALDKRPACARVVAEPDLRNIPSVTAFLSAGFRFSAEIALPAKRAALMVRDRSLRDLL